MEDYCFEADGNSSQQYSPSSFERRAMTSPCRQPTRQFPTRRQASPQQQRFIGCSQMEVKQTLSPPRSIFYTSNFRPFITTAPSGKPRPQNCPVCQSDKPYKRNLKMDFETCDSDRWKEENDQLMFESKKVGQSQPRSIPYTSTSGKRSPPECDQLTKRMAFSAQSNSPPSRYSRKASPTYTTGPRSHSCSPVRSPNSTPTRNQAMNSPKQRSPFATQNFTDNPAFTNSCSGPFFKPQSPPNRNDCQSTTRNQWNF